MKFYYANGASSLSPHIVLREAGMQVDPIRVDLTTMKTESGVDYATITEKGYVPALELNDGQVLTEGSVIVQYIADHKPESGLAPKAGTLERYQMQEWLNFISSEIHKSFSTLFRKDAGEEARKTASANIAKRFDYVSKQMKDKKFLLEEKFTVADAYLFTMVTWADSAKMDLGRWPVLKAFHAQVAARPNVEHAMKLEGLELKKAA